MKGAAGEAELAHSKAFENLVRGPNDIVGLLAYAKFKQSVHEAARSGIPMDRASRNITPAMVEVLRLAAEQMVAEMVADGIQASAPDIERSALRTAMDAQFTETVAAIREERGKVVSHIDQRTSFVSAFLTNLAAWVATLIIAVLIIFLYNRPPIESLILGTTRPAQEQQIQGVRVPQVEQPQPTPKLEDKTTR